MPAATLKHTTVTPHRPSASTTILLATDITKSYAGRTVLEGIDIRATPGHRVGIVGENGAGKSTLLRLLAGLEVPDSGNIERPDDFAYLPQEPEMSGTVAQVLAAALAPLHSAVRRVETLSAAMVHDPAAAAPYARALEWAERHDAWDADRRTKLAADRLGVSGIGPDRRVQSLSGGERSRLALAAMITTRPGCVLLDEPTNHLDDAAMDLLEDFLSSLPGIVVAASHDRVFLDRIATEIVDLDPTAFGTDGHGGRRYGGGFTQYRGYKAAARRRWEATYAAQQTQIAELREAARIDTSNIAPGRGPRDNDKFIYSFKGGNVDRAVARRVHDAQRRLAVAERNQVPRPPRPLVFRGQLSAATAELGAPEISIRIRDVHVPGRVRVPHLDVRTGDKLLLTGPNGSGKSSLLGVLAGRLRPSGGSVQVAAGRIGLLEQDVVFPDPDASALATFADAIGAAARYDDPDGAAAEHLTALGLLRPREIGSPVGTLSVGQRRRLALAIMIAGSPDLVLLDEPTNHISLTLATELEDALGAALGTIVVASHDRWLRRQWQGPVYPME
jgi:macrolide transport system ATP-binding/permease protein